MDERHDLTIDDYVSSGIDEIIMNANSFKLEYEVSRDRGALPLDDDLAIEVDNCDRHRVLKLNDFFDNLRESGGIPVAQPIGGEYRSQVRDIANMRLEPIKDDLLLPTPVHRELCRGEDDQQRRNIECELDSKAPQPPLDTREFQWSEACRNIRRKTRSVTPTTSSFGKERSTTARTTKQPIRIVSRDY